MWATTYPSFVINRLVGKHPSIESRIYIFRFTPIQRRLHLPIYTMWSEVRELRHGSKPYHSRDRVRIHFFTVGVHANTIIHRRRFLHDCNRYHRSTRLLQAAPIAASDRRSLWASHTPRPASKFTLTPANIHPENSKICKVSRGHFANLQSVPGTLCKTAKCPGETLHRMNYHAKFTRDTLQFCKVFRGHVAYFRFFHGFPTVYIGCGFATDSRRIR